MNKYSWRIIIWRGMVVSFYLGLHSRLFRYYPSANGINESSRAKFSASRNSNSQTMRMFVPQRETDNKVASDNPNWRGLPCVKVNQSARDDKGE